MKKVLLITSVDFWAKSSGHRMRISTLIEYLAKNVELTVVYTGPMKDGTELVIMKEFTIGFFVLEKVKDLTPEAYGRRFKKFLTGKHFDAMIFEYIYSSYFLNYLVEDTKLILDMHDIFSNRADEFAKFDYAGQIETLPRETEIEILNIYDHIIVLCKNDFDEITAVTSPGKALLCPHPVPTRTHTIKKEVKKIAFIASNYPPNEDGIIWFVKNCWSKISETYNFELWIYGTVCQNLYFQHPKIVCKGFVKNIDRIYDQADIIINPVRFGAGIKIKNVEALAHGKPLITASHGARGLEDGINNSFLVADSPEEFVEKVISLVESISLRQKLGANAQMLIENYFSVSQCFEPLLRAITTESSYFK